MEITAEASMFAISGLKSMELIDINTGTKLGYIKDFKINCDEHRIDSIILPTQKAGWFTKHEDISIPWEKITKIGIDVILIDAAGYIENI